MEDILTWTEERFDLQQAEIYTEVLTLALEALVDGTEVIGATPCDDILPGIHVLHVARYGKRGRHYLVFQARETCHIEVLRILHDSMDLVRHLNS